MVRLAQTTSELRPWNRGLHVFGVPLRPRTIIRACMMHRQRLSMAYGAQTALEAPALTRFVRVVSSVSTVGT